MHRSVDPHLLSHRQTSEWHEREKYDNYFLAIGSYNFHTSTQFTALFSALFRVQSPENQSTVGSEPDSDPTQDSFLQISHSIDINIKDIHNE